jgi:hypothetical protein
MWREIIHLIISNTAIGSSSLICMLLATLHNPQSSFDCEETLHHLKNGAKLFTLLAARLDYLVECSLGFL